MLFMANDEHMDPIVQSMNWEAILCDKTTLISWYFE
ncbi:DUF2711 family protein [Bacillus sp. 1P06AnD]